MTVMRSSRKAPVRVVHDARLTKLGEDYLALVDANNRSSRADLIRADREAHQATRPCPVCDTPMTAGACADHGTPAEDRGEWLWAR